MRVKVKKVIDGDTFEDTRHRFFRLEGVDAPEKKKREYNKTKKTLKDMIDEKELMVNQVGESYGRKVVKARIPGEKTTINAKMKRKL
jgi:endonuclease YncB( thermonuclease family)